MQVVPETYIVTYDLDGGVLSASNPLAYEVSDLENGGITLHNPSKTGYTFLGWTEEAGTGAATTAMTILPGTARNLHFTAHWQAAPAVLRFDTDGGTAVTDLTGTTGQEISGELPVTTRPGYTFQGWYDANGGYVSTLPEYFPAGITTYTARWTLRTDLGYTVRYYKDSVSDGNLLGTVSGTGTWGDAIPAENGIYCPVGYLAQGAVSGAGIITETETSNVVEVVYTRVSDLHYTVVYLEADTRRELAESKTVDGLTYGDIITEKAIALKGYRLAGPETRTLIVGMGENVLVFYYQAEPADTVVTPAGSGSSEGGNSSAVTADNTVTAAAQDSTGAEESADMAVLPVAAAAAVQMPVFAPAGDGAAAAGTVPAEAGTAAGTEEIPEADTPLTQAPAEETIGDGETPLAGSNGGWALLNLILAGLTVLGGVLMLAGVPGKSGIRRATGLVPAIAAVVAFIVTENITMPMMMADRWTLLMVLIALVQVGVALLGRKGKADSARA